MMMLLGQGSGKKTFILKCAPSASPYFKISFRVRYKYLENALCVELTYQRSDTLAAGIFYLYAERKLRFEFILAAAIMIF